MAITTFDNETILLRIGKYAVVEADSKRFKDQRVLIAVNVKTGYTDFLLYLSPLARAGSNYPALLWDRPEAFPKRFRERANRVATKHRGNATSRDEGRP